MLLTVTGRKSKDSAITPETNKHTATPLYRHGELQSNVFPRRRTLNAQWRRHVDVVNVLQDYKSSLSCAAAAGVDDVIPVDQCVESRL